MAWNYNQSEKLLELRRLDLQREMERRRLLAELPKRQRNIGKNAVYELGALLVKLGMWLKQIDQLREPVGDRA